jgi:hypothetical protein
VFVGHGITLDLKVMGIYDVPFYCTKVLDRGPTNQTRKLQYLAEKHLNATIQEGHHSSIIDSRASLALFLKFKDVYGLELDGPCFCVSGESYSLSTAARRRRNKKVTASNMIGRQAFKFLDGDSSGPQPFNIGSFDKPEKESELPPLDQELQILISSCK